MPDRPALPPEVQKLVEEALRSDEWEGTSAFAGAEELRQRLTDLALSVCEAERARLLSKGGARELARYGAAAERRRIVARVKVLRTALRGTVSAMDVDRIMGQFIDELEKEEPDADADSVQV